MQQISKLNLEELKEVYNKNQKLRDVVFDDNRMDDDYYVNDNLELFERVEYVKSYK